MLRDLSKMKHTKEQMADKTIKTIAFLLSEFFEKEDWPYKYYISYIELMYETETNVRIMIQMHRPGLLIGKGGSFLDKLEKRLEKYYKKKVDIYIEENPLWYL